MACLLVQLVAERHDRVQHLLERHAERDERAGDVAGRFVDLHDGTTYPAHRVSRMIRRRRPCSPTRLRALPAADDEARVDSAPRQIEREDPNRGDRHRCGTRPGEVVEQVGDLYFDRHHASAGGDAFDEVLILLIARWRATSAVYRLPPRQLSSGMHHAAGAAESASGPASRQNRDRCDLLLAVAERGESSRRHSAVLHRVVQHGYMPRTLRHHAHDGQGVSDVRHARFVALSTVEASGEEDRLLDGRMQDYAEVRRVRHRIASSALVAISSGNASPWASRIIVNAMVATWSRSSRSLMVAR